jgi:hypothetical protein
LLRSQLIIRVFSRYFGKGAGFGAGLLGTLPFIYGAQKLEDYATDSRTGTAAGIAAGAGSQALTYTGFGVGAGLQGGTSSLLTGGGFRAGFGSGFKGSFSAASIGPQALLQLALGTRNIKQTIQGAENSSLQYQEGQSVLGQGGEAPEKRGLFGRVVDFLGGEAAPTGVNPFLKQRENGKNAVTSRAQGLREAGKALGIDLTKDAAGYEADAKRKGLVRDLGSLSAAYTNRESQVEDANGGGGVSGYFRNGLGLYKAGVGLSGSLGQSKEQISQLQGGLQGRVFEYAKQLGLSPQEIASKLSTREGTVEIQKKLAAAKPQFSQAATESKAANDYYSLDAFASRGRKQRAPLVEALKGQYGISQEQLNKLGPNENLKANTLPRAALVALANEASHSNLNDFKSSGKLDLLNELGGKYIGKGFDAANFASGGKVDLKKLYGSNEGKAFADLYRKDVGTLNSRGVSLQTPGSQASNPGFTQFTNRGGYTYPGQDQFGTNQREYDTAQQKVFVNGGAAFTDNSARAQYIRGLTGASKDAFLGTGKTANDYYRDSLTPQQQLQYQQNQAQADSQRGFKAQEDAYLHTGEAAAPGSEVYQRRFSYNSLNADQRRQAVTTANQPPAGNEQTTPDLAQTIKDALGGDFAKNIGAGIAATLNGENGAGGTSAQVQIQWPKLEVDVQGGISVDGKPVGPDNNIAVMIYNQVVSALGRQDLVKPQKQDAGQTTPNYNTTQ